MRDIKSAMISLILVKLSDSPGPPTSIEPGGTYARSSSPEPQYLRKRINPSISGIIGYHWQLQKNIPFAWFSQEIFSRLWPQNPPPPLSRENGNAHAAPLCFRVRAQADSLTHLHVYHTVWCFPNNNFRRHLKLAKPKWRRSWWSYGSGTCPSVLSWRSDAARFATRWRWS